MEPCYEKNSEFPTGHDLRKYTARVCYQGNTAKDEHWVYAVFQELSSSASTVEATRTADAYGLLRGIACEVSDAIRSLLTKFR